MAALVLASTSKIRAKILTDAGFQVRAVAPAVSEDPGTIGEAAALAEALALRKARAVAERYPDAWVLGADQVVHDPAVPGAWWGKPVDDADHLDRLRALRGRCHELVSGWAILGPDAMGCSLAQSGVERARAWVRRDLEEAELVAYVADGEGRWCAGGYAVEGKGSFLFDRIDGDWNTVLGLPLFSVISALRARGWRAIPAAGDAR